MKSLRDYITILEGIWDDHQESDEEREAREAPLIAGDPRQAALSALCKACNYSWSYQQDPANVEKYVPGILKYVKATVIDLMDNHPGSEPSVKLILDALAKVSQPDHQQLVQLLRKRYPDNPWS